MTHPHELADHIEKLTPEHKLLCDVAAVRAHLDKYSRIEQRALLSRVMDHLNAIVEAQRAAPPDLSSRSVAKAEQPAADPETGREEIAEIIYNAMPYDEPRPTPEKPPWIPNGNSLKQDEARRYADAVIAYFSPTTPAKEPELPAARPMGQS